MPRKLDKEFYILNGDMSAASVVGPWLQIEDVESISFQVTWTGAPTGTWGADVTDDSNPANPRLGPTPLTLTSDMIAANPSGAAGSFLFQFNPRPDCRFMRFNYTRASGGSAASLQVGAIGGGAGS